MPAYFSLIFSIKKKKNNKHLFADFVSLLKENGFTFKGGFFKEFADDTLEDIVKVNTAKLHDDFELGPDDHYSLGYRQICWNWREFSEVRLFIYNCREDDFFTIHIIVPEDEVSEYADWKALALEAWKKKYIAAVQASSEGSEDMSPDDIKGGEMPTAEPFAIVPASYLTGARKDGFSYTNIRRKGVFIERI